MKYIILLLMVIIINGEKFELIEPEFLVLKSLKTGKYYAVGKEASTEIKFYKENLTNTQK